MPQNNFGWLSLPIEDISIPPCGGGIVQFVQIKCCSIAGQKEHAILTILRQIQPSPNSTIHKTLFSPFVQVTKVF